MLKNAPTLAIVAVDTAKNEPLQVLGVVQFNIQSCPYLGRAVKLRVLVAHCFDHFRSENSKGFTTAPAVTVSRAVQFDVRIAI